MLLGGWLPPNMTCPPGLEYLMDLEYLFVNQKIELLQGEFSALPRKI